MMGFVYKDFCLMRKQLLYMAFLMILYTVLTGIGAFAPSILSAIVIVFGLIYPMNAFAYDEQARWDKFAVSTPAGRRGVVAGRYLFSLLLMVISAAATAVLLGAISLLPATDEPLFELLFPVLACTAIALVMDAVILPILFKFGPEKARILSIIVFAIIFFGCMGLGALASKGRLVAISDQAFTLAVAPLAVAAVILYLLSYRLSLRIYAKKEL